MPIALVNWIVFIFGSAVFVYISRRSLLQPRSHGFYRFFAWECLLALFVLNWQSWIDNPLAWHQLISWTLLVLSLVLVIEGLRLLRRIGRRDSSRDDDSLLPLEKTAKLVTSGLYSRIRHPLYSSLLCLGWGMFFKSPSPLDLGLALLCSLFLTATARIEEGENLRYFGPDYAAYMRDTKMFIPFIL